MAHLWTGGCLFFYENMTSLFAWLSRVRMSISYETDMQLCMLMNQICTVIWVHMEISWYDRPCLITVHLIWYLAWLCWAWAVCRPARTVIIYRMTPGFDRKETILKDWRHSWSTVYDPKCFGGLNQGELFPIVYKIDMGVKILCTNALDVSYELAWMICFNVASLKHRCIPMKMQVRVLTWWKAEHLSRLQLGSWGYCVAVAKRLHPFHHVIYEWQEIWSLARQIHSCYRHLLLFQEDE